MAVPAFDGVVTDTSVNNQATATIGHTVNASLTNSLLIVMVSTSVAVASTCTWDGTPMTRLFSINGSGNPVFFYLQAPASGTHNIVVTWPVNAFSAAVTIATLVNVSQDHLPRWADSKFETNDATSTVTPPFALYPGSMLVAWTQYSDATTYSSTDQTLLDGPFAVGGGITHAASFYGLGATSLTVTWTVAGKQRMLAGIAIPPVFQQNRYLDIF